MLPRAKFKVTQEYIPHFVLLLWVLAIGFGAVVYLLLR